MALTALVRRGARALCLAGLLAPMLSACGGSDELPPPLTEGPPENSAPGPIGPQSAILSWTAIPDPDVAGYRVYYGTAAGKYGQVRGQGLPTRATSHTVDGLQSGMRYYFAVTAVDSDGNESGFSQEVTKLIQ